MTTTRQGLQGIAITWYFAILLFLFPLATSGQETGSSISKQTLNYLDPVYGVDQRLVSGPFYNRKLDGSINGNPYAYGSEWKIGTVSFDGITFTDLLLRYDIEENSVVLNFRNINGSSHQIELKKNNIESFTLEGKVFVPLPEGVMNDSTWFCELMAEGDVDYLVLRYKSLKVKGGSGSSGYYYREDMKQLLRNDDMVVKFKSKRTLFRLYPHHKQEIKKYMKERQIYPYRFRMEDRAAMVRYCNYLTGGEE